MDARTCRLGVTHNNIARFQCAHSAISSYEDIHSQAMKQSRYAGNDMVMTLPHRRPPRSLTSRSTWVAGPC